MGPMQRITVGRNLAAGSGPTTGIQFQAQAGVRTGAEIDAPITGVLVLLILAGIFLLPKLEV